MLVSDLEMIELNPLTRFFVLFVLVFHQPDKNMGMSTSLRLSCFGDQVICFISLGLNMVKSPSGEFLKLVQGSWTANPSCGR